MTLVYCPACGVVYVDAWTYCAHCGDRYLLVPVENDEEAERKREESIGHNLPANWTL